MVHYSPEEEVRQNLLENLVARLGYPPSLISVEIALSNLSTSVPRSIGSHRVDIVCFVNTPHGAVPLLLIECKRRKPSMMVLAQLYGYNNYLGCMAVAIAWPKMITIYANGSLLCQGPLLQMPTYAQLCDLFSFA